MSEIKTTETLSSQISKRLLGPKRKKPARRRYNVLPVRRSQSKEYTGPPTRDEATSEALKAKQKAKLERRAKQLAHLPVVKD